MICVSSVSPRASAQQAADQAEGLFDDGKSTDKDSKEKARKKPEVSVTDREKIGFSQENATAQMSELEERMFRLSEALRSLEPENASRLRLALKFSREELILEQMRDTHKMLKDAQLSKAETEIRELLAKLEHLRNVLLADDLDFQLKLARLRQMRETLGQLERIVKDQRRELGWSRFAIDQRKLLANLSARRPDLEKVQRDQGKLLEDSKALAAKEPSERDSGRQGLRDREMEIGKLVTALAADPIFANHQPSTLRKAVVPLREASTELGRTSGDLSSAITAEQKADDMLKEELKSLADRSAAADRDVAAAEFKKHEAGQLKTRGASEALSAASARLGDAGMVLQKDLIRAGSSMQGAERSLAKTSADTAASEQSEALDILGKAGDGLAKAAEKLLVQLRTELHARLITELTELHEAQAYIRETTQAQAPRLAKKSRSAELAMAGLAQKEGDLARRTEQLLGLVEETELGIALPTALRVFARDMHSVEAWLKEADASARTVAMEKRIEDDLQGLLQAVRRLPPTSPPSTGTPLPSDSMERERELNRLVAELKTIRLLQVRLNDDTIGVDKSRPGNSSAIPPAIRREIEGLESSQEDLRESLSKISERIEQP